MKKIDFFAQVAHEANRAYCIMLGDTSLQHWENAPAWQWESCMQAVVGVLAGNTPKKSHEDWLALKEKEGWKYGPVKNTEAREHPCMVHYKDLPEEQKVRDQIFVGIVRLLESIARREVEESALE